MAPAGNGGDARNDGVFLSRSQLQHVQRRRECAHVGLYQPEANHSEFGRTFRVLWPSRGIAPDAKLDCGSQVERLDSTSASVGNFYDADALQHSLAHPDAGTPLTPGSTFSGGGVSFLWPSVPVCNEDNISTRSTPQTILMPPNSGETSSTTTTLGFLGAGAGGATSGPVTINYSDGTSSTQTLDFGDWCQNTPSDQTLVATAKRTDGTLCHVFEKVLPVTPSKVVTSITLPATSSLTGGDWMRIFGIGLAVNGKTFPQLSWSPPADITYGTALSATQLNATANGVAGTFAYSPTTGTSLHAGANQTLSATFTPTGATASDWASGTTVTTKLNVDKSTCKLSWPKPANIVYSTIGVGLGPAQLDANSDCPGTFQYTPNFGFQLTAGPNQLLSATFTPADTRDYQGGTVTTTINVLQYTPQFSWDAPSSSDYGVPLSVIQLDPIADSAGSFTFNPPAGTILPPGRHTLKATFVPTDSKDFVGGGTVTTTLTVTKAPCRHPTRERLPSRRVQQPR